MSNIHNIIASLLLLLVFQVSAQNDNAVADLNFKLKLMNDKVTVGVYVVPGEAINPTKRSSTGAGQITIVAPAGFAYAGLENFGGTWVENARVDSPMEAPESAYISFGFVADEPRIKYFAGEETLLFTFVPENVDAEISLFENDMDPFSAPNTYGSNPGNDLGVVDFDRDGGILVYNYGFNLDAENETEFKAIFASEKTAGTKH
jgi:hypothetical protein